MKTKFTFLVAAMLAIVQSTGHAQSRGHHRSVPHRPNTHHSHNNHHSNNGMRNVLAVVGAGLIVNSIIESNRSAYYYSSEYVYTRPNVNYTTVAAREYYWDGFASCWRVRVVYRRVPCYP